jgi:hypothetical protein
MLQSMKKDKTVLARNVWYCGAAMEEVTPQAGAKDARPPSVREVEVLALVG